MFEKAKPVWLEGLSREQNCFVAFTCEAVDLKGTSLHVTAATFYFYNWLAIFNKIIYVATYRSSVARYIH